MGFDESYDLVIVNGHVIDPANEINKVMDIAVKDGKIAKLADKIDGKSAKKVVDAKGHYVVPGLVDIHTHVYPLFPYPERGLHNINADDHFLKEGCTTTVDAGSVGWRDFLDFKDNVIDKSKCRVLAFLNIASKGMVDMQSEQFVKNMHPEIVASLIKTFPEELVGVKAAHYRPGGRPAYDAENPAWGSVAKTIEAGELSGTPCMIDFGVCPKDSPYDELLLKWMRPGDMHTHVFAQQFPVINEEGKVFDYMWEAKEKGILFDVGHGGGSFWFRQGKRAMDDGFMPDSISTDLHTGSIGGAAQSMLHTMGKFLNMGMGLEEVIARSTNIPAEMINRPELGNLSEGGCADIAIISLIEGDYDYVDNGRAKLKGTSRFDCRMTVREGDIVFDGYGMSMPYWEEAPESYWKEYWS